MLIGVFAPVKVTEVGLITVSGAVSTKLGTASKSLPACFPVTAIEEVAEGDAVVAFALEILNWLIIEGKFVLKSVVVVEPPTSPKVTDFPVLAFPAPIGARPFRLGKAKVVVPLPPYVVPSSENSA